MSGLRLFVVDLSAPGEVVGCIDAEGRRPSSPATRRVAASYVIAAFSEDEARAIMSSLAGGTRVAASREIGVLEGEVLLRESLDTLGVYPNFAPPVPPEIARAVAVEAWEVLSGMKNLAAPRLRLAQ